MASGRKNYFRHSFNAFEDEKIQKCIELLGYEGYAYYFILIELLAKQCENEFKNPIRIHPQTLRIIWRKQTKSCKKVLTKLQQSGLFVVTFTESFIELDIPNLVKYMGKYTTKSSPNVSNKKKIKEKKINIEKNDFKDQAIEVLEYLNAKRKEVLPNSKGFKPVESNLKGIITLLKEKNTIEEIKFVLDNKIKDPYFIDSEYKYYTPETLFRKSKYYKYNAEQPIIDTNDHVRNLFDEKFN